MEVYVLRKLKDDETKEEHYVQISRISSYKNNDRITLHLIDIADEGHVLFDVVKFEVY